MHECLVMLAVFRGCMVTRTLPTSASPCARKVCELLATLDPTGELAPDNFAAGGGTDAESRILPRSLPPVAIPPTNVKVSAPLTGGEGRSTEGRELP